MIDNERYWELVSRHLAGESSDIEEQELSGLLASSPQLQKHFDTLLEYWGKSKQRSAIDTDKAYLRVRERLMLTPVESPSGSRSMGRWWLAAAASVVVLMVAFAAFYTPGRSVWRAIAWESKVNGKGERSKIALPDGSTVWLNADSRIEYPGTFSDQTREVYLSGEGFFDIVKNPQKPFIIHLQNGDVRVLGTSFNVKSFDDEGTVETSVVTGKVAFIGKGNGDTSPHDTVFLTPNFKAILSKESGSVVKRSTNGLDDKAWTEGKLVFKSQRFEEVARVLERNYGKTIVFVNEDIKNCKLTGSFQNNSLEEVLRLFAQTKDYSYKFADNELFINGSGCAASE